jgi:hypothetical protein
MLVVAEDKARKITVKTKTKIGTEERNPLYLKTAPLKFIKLFWCGILFF